MSTILLVEDDKSLREIYGLRMQAEGYQVVEASDGEEGLAQAVANAPDLIVSDAMMPKISGFEMLDLLKSNDKTKNIKVIIMTALSSDTQRQRGEGLGADRYLVKSQVGIEDLINVIHSVLADRPSKAVSPVETSSGMTPTVMPPTDPIPNSVQDSIPAAVVAAPANVFVPTGKTSNIPSTPMSVPTVINPINSTAITQAAPETPNITASPFTPIDPVARLTSTAPTSSSLSASAQPVFRPVPSSQQPSTSMPQSQPQPTATQSAFIGQNPSLTQPAPDDDQDTSAANEQLATTEPHVLSGLGGMGRVIQPPTPTETLHPQVDINALLDQDAAANLGLSSSNPTQLPSPTSPSADAPLDEVSVQSQMDEANAQLPTASSNTTLKFNEN